MLKLGVWLGIFLFAGALAPARGAVVPWTQTMLWQEHFYWDALLSARSRAARQQADPNLLNVVRALSQQAAQQSANLQQIQTYTHTQQDNLRLTLAQKDPSRSLATIRANLETLTTGTNQIRSNLFYIAARCRMAVSQVLPDPELTREATVLIGQIQAAQLQLNALYADAAAVQKQITGAAWLRDPSLRYNANALLRSVIRTQDSVYPTYNTAYEIYLRSR